MRLHDQAAAWFMHGQGPGCHLPATVAVVHCHRQENFCKLPCIIQFLCCLWHLQHSQHAQNFQNLPEALKISTRTMGDMSLPCACHARLCLWNLSFWNSSFMFTWNVTACSGLWRYSRGRGGAAGCSSRSLSVVTSAAVGPESLALSLWPYWHDGPQGRSNSAKSRGCALPLDD